jgi:hypothetical protein
MSLSTTIDRERYLLFITMDALLDLDLLKLFQHKWVMMLGWFQYG